MGFKKIGMREIVLVSIAVLLLVVTFFANHKPVATALPDAIKQPEIMEQPISKFEANDEDDGLKEMQEQMDADRSQQRQIKMLKMQLEQVSLQLENEKAMAEINKLKREDAGYVKDPDLQGVQGFPSIKIIYIGGAEAEKEAILVINGTSYSVKEKDRPVANMEILGITDQGVKVHLSAPQQMTTFINYVQE